MRRMKKKTSYDEYTTGDNAKIELDEWYDAPNRSDTLFPHAFIYCRRWGSHKIRHYRYPEVAIEFMLIGSAVFHTGTGKTVVNANEIFIMQRGEDSGFQTNAEDSYEKITLCFSGSILELLCKNLKLNKIPKIKLSHPEECKRRFQEIRDLLHEKAPGTENRLSELAYSLFLFLAGENRETADLNFPHALRLALQFLRGNYMHPDFSMRELASFSGSSIPTLIRLFRKYCGQTPQECITEMRMSLAKELLESTSLQIKEIAERSGYSNQLYFSTAFRKYTGTGPREYRKTRRPDPSPKE